MTGKQAAAAQIAVTGSSIRYVDVLYASDQMLVLEIATDMRYPEVTLSRGGPDQEKVAAAQEVWIWPAEGDIDTLFSKRSIVRLPGWTRDWLVFTDVSKNGIWVTACPFFGPAERVTAYQKPQEEP
jgi:hypothetical protein